MFGGKDIFPKDSVGRCLRLRSFSYMTDRLILIILRNEPVHEISNNVVCATSEASDQPAHTRSLIRAFASRLNIL